LTLLSNEDGEQSSNALPTPKILCTYMLTTMDRSSTIAAAWGRPLGATCLTDVGEVMDVLCLDLEGVLIPEIWVGVAERTGINELRKTTRDIPVYDELMQMRLGILERNGIDFGTIQEVIATLRPLPGAADFLTWARSRFQVAIISDTFYEFAQPLMAQLDWPLLLCHRLNVVAGRIAGYTIRQPDPKRQSVKAFQSLRYRVLAVGDSYNDIPMLEQSDQGIFYRCPPAVAEQYPQFPGVKSYQALQELLSASAAVT
jgi:phosphoserine / homoserine phosphotransferase